MAGLLITFAVKEEAIPFQRLASPASDLRVVITGMGRRNAESSIRGALEDPSVRAVLTCGFAGGLNPELGTGVVLYSADEDLPLLPALTANAAQLARFHCATRVAVTVAEKTSLRAQTGADAVEMESGVIRTLCRSRGIPSATVRVISDPAGEDLPLDFNRLLDAHQNLSPGRLALAVLSAPWKVGGLIRLRHNTRLAADNLARVLVAVTAVRAAGA